MVVIYTCCTWRIFIAIVFFSFNRTEFYQYISIRYCFRQQYKYISLRVWCLCTLYKNLWIITSQLQEWMRISTSFHASISSACFTGSNQICHHKYPTFLSAFQYKQMYLCMFQKLNITCCKFIMFACDAMKWLVRLLPFFLSCFLFAWCFMFLFIWLVCVLFFGCSSYKSAKNKYILNMNDFEMIRIP